MQMAYIGARISRGYILFKLWTVKMWLNILDPSASQQHYPAVLDKHKSVIKTKQKSNEFYVSGQKAFVDCFKHHDLKEKFHPWK